MIFGVHPAFFADSAQALEEELCWHQFSPLARVVLRDAIRQFREADAQNHVTLAEVRTITPPPMPAVDPEAGE